MLVVSWNMAMASPRIGIARREEAWSYLRGLNSDIALVQEAWNPKEIFPDHAIVWEPAYEGKPWGSAIITRYNLESTVDVAMMDPALTDLVKRFRGQVVAAKLRLDNNGSLVTISVHTPARTVPRKDVPLDVFPVIKLKQNRWIWRADVIYGALRHLPEKGDRFIMGGDWNTSRLFDKMYGPRGNEEFFQRMSDAHFRDCRERFFPDEQRTWFRSEDAHYQLDHVFCDSLSAANIKEEGGYRIDPTPAENGLSDHAAVIVEFN